MHKTPNSNIVQMENGETIFNIVEHLYEKAQAQNQPFIQSVPAVKKADLEALIAKTQELVNGLTAKQKLAGVNSAKLQKRIADAEKSIEAYREQIRLMNTQKNCAQKQTVNDKHRMPIVKKVTKAEATNAIKVITGVTKVRPVDTTVTHNLSWWGNYALSCMSVNEKSDSLYRAVYSVIIPRAEETVKTLKSLMPKFRVKQLSYLEAGNKKRQQELLEAIAVLDRWVYQK